MPDGRRRHGNSPPDDRNGPGHAARAVVLRQWPWLISTGCSSPPPWFPVGSSAIRGVVSAFLSFLTLKLWDVRATVAPGPATRLMPQDSRARNANRARAAR